MKMENQNLYKKENIYTSIYMIYSKRKTTDSSAHKPNEIVICVDHYMFSSSFFICAHAHECEVDFCNLT